MPMLLSEETFATMMGAFREKPGNYANAARISRVDQRTAKRGWTEGWPHLMDKRAIRDIIADEEEAIRTRQIELKAEEKAAARKDRVEQKAVELQAAKGALSMAMTNVATLGLLQKAIVKVAERTAAALDRDSGELTFAQGMAVLREYSEASQRAGLVVKRALEALRLAVGEPTHLVGVQHTLVEPPVQVDRALEALGSEEAVHQAAAALFSGDLTPEALKLIESQLGHEAPS